MVAAAVAAVGLRMRAAVEVEEALHILPGQLYCIIMAEVQAQLEVPVISTQHTAMQIGTITVLAHQVEAAAPALVKMDSMVLYHWSSSQHNQLTFLDVCYIIAE